MMWCSAKAKTTNEKKSFLNSATDAMTKTNFHKIINKDKCTDIFRDALSDISEKMNKNADRQWVRYKFDMYRLTNVLKKM